MKRIQFPLGGLFSQHKNEWLNIKMFDPRVMLFNRAWFFRKS